MWAPHPRGRVIRRPQPDFSHRRPRIQRRSAPQELADVQSDPRRDYKYFGIHGSDVTDYLKQPIPSHAFHPSIVGSPPPVISGRRPRNSEEERRPDTAPASTPWFGRTCTDISDWLRYRPPAHLGLDPDNEPLPYYPTSTSLVTDPKWQTKEFPALPNILWHWWADRPSSVPLATNPQQVEFGTLVDALKHRTSGQTRHQSPRSVATARSGAQTPRSGAETPRSVVGGGARLPGECTTTPRPGTPGRVAGSGTELTRPPATEGSRPGSTATTPRLGSAAGDSPRWTPPPGQSGRTPPSTPRQSGGTGVSMPGTPRSAAGSPRVEPGTIKFNGHPAAPTFGEGHEVNSTPTVANSKPPSPASGAARPPPSPGPRHPNPPHLPKQATPRKPFPRHPAAVPSGLFIQGQGQILSSPASGGERTSKPATVLAKPGHRGATLDDLKIMSPDAFATKLVWTEKFKNRGQGNPWPSEEGKTRKALKAH